jgi:hypothetical protein
MTSKVARFCFREFAGGYYNAPTSDLVLLLVVEY